MQTAEMDLVGDNDNHVLMMPDILDQVFSHLGWQTLKSIRLVCTTWADVGAKFLGNKGHLAFSTSPIVTNCKELTSFNHKLARNIKLHMSCNCDWGCDCSSEELQTNRNLPSNFAILLPEICGKLDTLDFNIESTLNPHLHEMWATYQFPNLARISIIVINVNQLDEKFDVPLETPEFRRLQNLKVFSLRILPHYGKHISGVVYSSICQKLLNAAPNLEEFNIKMNFCPDLTPCRKLKNLKFEYRDLANNVQVDIPKMVRMLENCRHSLEKLTLGYHHQNIEEPIKLSLTFPNLTHLNIEAVDMYQIDDPLNTCSLPKLTHFSIHSWKDIPGLITTYQLCHPGVTSLSVGCTYFAERGSQDGPAAGKLVNMFPGVKEFTLKLRYLPGDFLPLKEMMRSLGDWDLTRGQVDIERVWSEHEEEFDENAIIAVFEGMAEWKGLKNTSLRLNGGYVEGSFKISDGMKASFLTCRTIRNVTMEGFEIAGETLVDFGTFIVQNNLPIDITIFHGF